jgi:hypothetical protein
MIVEYHPSIEGELKDIITGSCIIALPSCEDPEKYLTLKTYKI